MEFDASTAQLVTNYGLHLVIFFENSPKRKVKLQNIQGMQHAHIYKVFLSSLHKPIPTFSSKMV